MSALLKTASLLLLLVPAGAFAAAEGFAGTWSGSFEIHFADGRVVNDGAWLMLDQAGATVSGTVGPRADQQGPIRRVVAKGNELAFVADSSQGKVLRFRLERNGNRLSGDATGEIGNDTVRVVVATTRQESSAALPASQVRDRMLALDTAMFDAFNKCSDPAELAKHAAYFDKDAEFYHDLGGLTRGADAVVDATRRNVCGKFHRELDVASFKAWPIPGYGAISTGTHRFCHTATTCEGAGEFTMVWREKDGVWQVTRALSYAHRDENVPAAGAAARK